MFNALRCCSHHWARAQNGLTSGFVPRSQIAGLKQREFGPLRIPHQHRPSGYGSMSGLLASHILVIDTLRTAVFLHEPPWA